ncbi:MAG: D-TA family PLP-dependent enzyme [Pirellulaceae bacterium]|nr:D-TA family PLP-dependent enzyme [Planctomycetales bacterium]
MAEKLLAYEVPDVSRIESPAVLIYWDRLMANVESMLRIAKKPQRLRPHCKTHKIREVARVLVDRGVTRHKAATFSEVEMLASAGAKDICLAYNVVGPNIRRTIECAEKFPQTRLSVLADDRRPIAELSVQALLARQTIGVWLDVDTGLRRSGVASLDDAVALYEQISGCEYLEPAGLHVYDGQNHQVDIDERRRAVDQVWRHTQRLREALAVRNLPVPAVVVGGTGSFPIFAGMDDPTIELSPGTVVIYDAGYAANFPDLPFTPAAALLTRVISRPASDRVTLDLGHKACAADPPLERRAIFPQLPDAQIVLHNEEHLVITTKSAAGFSPGDAMLAIPWHVCPTIALHRQVHIVKDGQVTGQWVVAARDR